MIYSCNMESVRVKIRGAGKKCLNLNFGSLILKLNKTKKNLYRKWNQKN
jgi:hypothetical protein